MKVLKMYKLILKNLGRYKRRSMLTGSVMVFSVIVFIYAAALGEAFYHQMVNVGIRTTTGHLQVYAKGWDFDIISPISGDVPKLTNTVELERLISKAPHVTAVSKEILYQGLLFGSSDACFAATVIGVEPQKVSQTLSGVQLAKGYDFSKGLDEGIYISIAMENFFKPQPDEMMYVITASPYGMMTGIKAPYKGVISSMPVFADRVAFVKIDSLRKLLRWSSDECNTIKVMTDDKSNAEKTAEWLKRELRRHGLDVEVKTWKELSGFYYYIAILGRILNFILLVILAAISGGTVSNTMLMSMRERVKEIGTMMAMGLRRRQILKLFLMESFFLSLFSCLLGLFIGSVFTLWQHHRGVAEGLELVLEGKLFPILNPLIVLLPFFWVLIIGTVSGFYPAYKASKLDPIEALRCL